MFNKCKIEIIVPHYSSYLDSLVSSWKSNDLYFTQDYDHLDQRIFSAFSPHIERIKTEKELARRILSLNILVNGAMFVADAKTRTKILNLLTITLKIKTLIKLLKKMVMRDFGQIQ